MKVLKVALLLLLLASCKYNEKRIENLTYGTVDTTQKTDLMLPKDRTSETPVVVLIHGGGWNGGDKSNFYEGKVDSVFLSKGFAVLSINYRLADDKMSSYPAVLQNVNSVYNMIQQHAREWHCNPQSVFLVGRSAGAHIAMLYAYSQKKKGIKGLGSFFGPVDFTDTSMLNHPLREDVARFLGCDYDKNKLLWRNASPLFYAHQAALPTFIVQGQRDNIVLPIQAEKLVRVLENDKTPYIIERPQYNGHALDTKDWIKYADAMADFFQFQDSVNMSK